MPRTARAELHSRVDSKTDSTVSEAKRHSFWDCRSSLMAILLGYGATKRFSAGLEMRLGFFAHFRDAQASLHLSPQLAHPGVVL